MRWMETIRLRVAEANNQEVEEILEEITKGILNGKVTGIKLYRHATVHSDRMIIIRWESDGVELQGSEAGRCITHILKSSVLASHTVWVEKE